MSVDVLKFLGDRRIPFAERLTEAVRISNLDALNSNDKYLFPHMQSCLLNWLTTSLLKMQDAAILDKNVWYLYDCLLNGENDYGILKYPLLPVFTKWFQTSSESTADASTLKVVVKTFLKAASGLDHAKNDLLGDNISYWMSFVKAVTEFIRKEPANTDAVGLLQFILETPIRYLLSLPAHQSNPKRTFSIVFEQLLPQLADHRNSVDHIVGLIIDEAVWTSNFVDELIKVLTSPMAKDAITSFKTYTGDDLHPSSSVKLLFSTDAFILIAPWIVEQALLMLSKHLVSTDRHQLFNFCALFAIKAIEIKNFSIIVHLLSVLAAKHAYQIRNDDIFKSQTAFLASVLRHVDGDVLVFCKILELNCSLVLENLSYLNERVLDDSLENLWWPTLSKTAADSRCLGLMLQAIFEFCPKIRLQKAVAGLTCLGHSNPAFMVEPINILRRKECDITEILGCKMNFLGIFVQWSQPETFAPTKKAIEDVILSFSDLNSDYSYDELWLAVQVAEHMPSSDIAKEWALSINQRHMGHNTCCDLQFALHSLLNLRGGMIKNTTQMTIARYLPSIDKQVVIDDPAIHSLLLRSAEFYEITDEKVMEEILLSVNLEMVTMILLIFFAHQGRLYASVSSRILESLKSASFAEFVKLLRVARHVCAGKELLQEFFKRLLEFSFNLVVDTSDDEYELICFLVESTIDFLDSNTVAVSEPSLKLLLHSRMTKAKKSLSANPTIEIGKLSKNIRLLDCLTSISTIAIEQLIDFADSMTDRQQALTSLAKAFSRRAVSLEAVLIPTIKSVINCPEGSKDLYKAAASMILGNIDSWQGATDFLTKSSFESSSAIAILERLVSIAPAELVPPLIRDCLDCAQQSIKSASQNLPVMGLLHKICLAKNHHKLTMAELSSILCMIETAFANSEHASKCVDACAPILSFLLSSYFGSILKGSDKEETSAQYSPSLLPTIVRMLVRMMQVCLQEDPSKSNTVARLISELADHKSPHLSLYLYPIPLHYVRMACTPDMEGRRRSKFREAFDLSIYAILAHLDSSLESDDRYYDDEAATTAGDDQTNQRMKRKRRSDSDIRHLERISRMIPVSASDQKQLFWTLVSDFRKTFKYTGRA